MFPVSFGQQRLWFLNEMEPANPVYRLARLKRITGDLDAGVMARVIQALVERHEALRTVFASVDGEPWQKICANVPVDVRFFGLEDIPAAGREAEALRIAREVVEQRLDLATGPLFRAALIKLQSREHWLLIVMHHIITDGWSMGILFGEMVDLYEAFAKGVEPELHPLPAQYRDYSSWQREHISGEFLASEIEYWTKKLAGMDPLLELPADRPRPAIPSGRGETEYFTIGADILEALRRLGQSEGATLFMTLLAVFQALLWRYSSQDSIAVGTPVAGRNDLETEALIGFFVNTLVMRADFSANPTWRELLRQVRSTALEAYAHQDLPFERLVEEMKPERALNHAPLFQVMFILQNMPRSQSGETSLVLEELGFASDMAKFDLTLEVVECGALDCAFEYNTDLFDRGTIQRTIGHFQQLIRGMAENPDGRISEAALLTDSERKQIVEDWNRTALDFPVAGTIHGAFEAQTARTPENIAFLHEGSELRYRELNERANRLAHLLISWGVK
ncbi:MAG: non-ribosomal peptide synthetase, partial [Acidobacteriia bacterium]|nr:non-ribosomal peptide synthetase [Terriglobia bacterium]